MRVPLATDLSTRDGTCTKDAKIVNGFVESKGDSAAVFKRPGSNDLGAVGTGTAQALACWDGQLKSIVGDTLADLIAVERAKVWRYINGYGSATLRGIAYGSAGYVTIDEFGESSISTYGVDSWSAPVAALADEGFSIVYGNGVYVACGANGECATTADAVTWTSRNSQSTLPLNKALFANGVFLLSDDVGTEFPRSTNNGATWSLATRAFLTSSASIFAANNKFYATSNGVLKYSTDGDSWTTATLPVSNLNIVAVVYDSVFGYVAVGEDGRFIMSANGTSGWTLDPNVIPQTRNIQSAISGAGRIIAFEVDLNDYVYAIYSGYLDFTDWTVESVGSIVITPSPYFLNGTFYLATDPSLSGEGLSYRRFSGYVEVVDTSEISPVTASADFFLESTGAAASTQYLMLKNSSQGFLYDGTTLSTITDVDYPGIHTVAVSSITRASSTATVTTTAAHPFITGDSVLIAGAVQTEYNGTFTVTVSDSTHFTYTVTGTPATPATGTITARGGSKRTVPGIAYLDGYFFVMDTDAVIRNCDLGDPTTWSGLDFIKAEKEPGLGKALSKTQNYIVAFKDWSTEFFYDAANATGSPLSPVDNGFVLIGCASGESVVNLDGTLIWVSKTKQAGKSVHLMSGLQPVEIATPDIQRVLNADDLSTVHSYGVKISGHAFYVLTLVSSDITIVYDLISKTWQQWSSLTLNGSSVNVTSITQSAGTATVTTATAHGLNDGDPVKISGANQSAYNGNKQVQVVSSTVFTFPVDSSTTTPATGTITATGYTESYFKYTKYVACNGLDLVLHESDGHLYELTEDAYQDAALPIDVLIRTGKLDDGTTNFKTVSKAEVIGNKVDSTALIRWSDDDYATSSSYRPIDLNAERSVTRRCGGFRRRSFDIRHCGNTPLQLAALELDTAGG